ncbi:MAG TPA: alanine--glyoxylate aminotransferase family protein [Aliiroseovarius sp.]|nr:alanine--glyoxylate aminotransferase family protein [Aliiroseovarius sp.]
MTLSHGRQYLAIPGPSVVPERVLNAMHVASANIYEGALVDAMPGLVAGLKDLAGTGANLAFYIGNGHAVWEASLVNVIQPGDKVLALANGRFGEGWAEVAKRLGAEVQVLNFGVQSPYDYERIAAALQGGAFKAVLAVQVDTSSTFKNDIKAVRRVMDDAGSDALLMADCVASLGCEVFEMDAWGVDVMIAASQKGLMMPPGLGFVFFSDKAASVSAAFTCPSPYWDWTDRANPRLFYQYWGGTAPTQILTGLQQVLDMIAEEGGRQAVWARHEKLAQAIWAACDAWGKGGDLKMNVAKAADRSHAVTALSLPAPLATDLRHWCETKAGVTLGIGLGMSTPEDPQGHGFFRVGHMGHVNAQMIMGVLGAMDAGMKALGIAHGAGALEAATAVLAKA